MAAYTRLAALLLGAALVMACGGGDQKKEPSQVSAATATVTAAAQATTTPATASFDYTRLDKYIPPDSELPDRVAYQAKFDLSNEAAASDPAQLKMFRDTGRLGGIQFILSVEAGARNVSVGISYYSNTDEPKKLLRGSGDPAVTNDPNRFTVPALGDEYIAQRLQLGSGEAMASVINVAWVRGRFFISLADLGGTADTPTDVAVKVARLIDDKLKANSTP